MPQDNERGDYRQVSGAAATSPPSRPSLEASSRWSSDDGDLQEIDPLNYDGGNSKPQQPRLGRAFDPKPVAVAHDRHKARRWNLRQWLTRRRLFWIVAQILAFSLFVFLVGGGAYLYKSSPQYGHSPAWYPSPRGGTLKAWEDSYRKAAEMVGRMTLLEKVNITTGTGWQMGMCVGNTGPAMDVGFPSLCLQDGPLGLRFVDNITAFPAGITVGATWDRELMYQRGKALGKEARLKGVNVWLGPSMGPLGRMPAGGRNWEGFGSDPVLQGTAAAATIKGAQSEGVMATAKHFIGNEQEHFRQPWEWGTPNALSANIDDRTLHELYAWPFADSVKAGVASVMCSYNQVNNSYACGNSKLLNGILKDELGFQGFVVSDWLGQRSGVASALAGLDMSMPGDGLRWTDGKSLWGKALTKAVLNTSIPMERLNDMVTRIVAAWYQLGQNDASTWPPPPPKGDGGPNFSSWEKGATGLLHPGSDDKAEGVVNKFVNAQSSGEEAHGKLARRIAAEGTVLVKNEDAILPLSRKGKAASTAADKNMRYRVAIFGEDAAANPEGPNACADRGCNTGTLASGWGSGAANFPYLITPIEALKGAFDNETVHVTEFLTNDPPFKKAPAMLTAQDLCIAFVNADSGEGFIAADGIKGDRNDLNVQKAGDDLVTAVANGCGGGRGDVIVVVHAVGPVILEEWIDHPNVKAVLLANLPGQESGNALVDVLFGDVNPSGKLPFTVGKSLDSYGEGAHIMYYPNAVVPQQSFTEGLYIDYRHFDKYGITPRYPFGYGLSYTTFELTGLHLQIKRAKSLLPDPRPADTITPPEFGGEIPDPSTAVFPKGWRRLRKFIYPYIDSVKDIKVRKYPYPRGYDIQHPPSPAGGGEGGNPSLYDVHANVQCTVTNTGNRDGATVVQLYISYPPGYRDPETGDEVDFPVRVLRGFEKVFVEGGRKSKQVKFNVTRRDLSYWDIRRQNWVMPSAGNFTFSLGFSSRDLPLSGTF